jgi:cob(I)alamin adenosyltransferase
VTRIYTRGGDDGTTGLLYGGRVDKSDLRTESYGAVDEAVAALGMARAVIADRVLADLVLRLQRELFVVGSELATAPRNVHKLQPGLTKVTAEMVDGLETLIDEYTARIRMPEEFIVPGEDQGSAFLDFARAVVRRAERRTVALERNGGLADRESVRYLNRLADLVFVLARYEEGDFRTLRSDR